MTISTLPRQQRPDTAPVAADSPQPVGRSPIVRIGIWLIAVVIVTFCADRVLSLVLDRVVMRSQFRYSKLYSAGPPHEIVILGNSRAVNSFHVPTMQQRLGVNALNLGYNGVSSDVAAALFGDYVERHGAPGMVIVEVTSIIGRAEALNDFRLYMRQSPELLKLYREQNKQAANTMAVAHLFGFNSEMFFRSLYYWNKSDQGWVNQGRLSPALAAAVDTMASVAWRIPAPRLTAVQQIVKQARAQQKEVRLIVAPYYQPYAAKISNLDSWIAEVEAATGERVWDLSTALGEQRYFADRLHINRAGSVEMLDMLIASGFFKTNAVPPAAR